MSFKNRVFNLMKVWCDELLKTQLDMPSEHLLNGAILCPGCALVHGRCADMVFPLVVLYSKTNEEKYLIAAKKLVDWTEYNLLTESGEYRNDLSNRWKGTNIFFCLALGETLHRFANLLDRQTFEKWDRIFRRNAFAALDFFDRVKPHINYYAAAAAMFAFAYNYTGEEEFLVQAKKHEQYCHALFDSEGLLFGEGNPHDATTAKGCHFIDMGYNIEESMPLLIMHSIWLNDEDKKNYYINKTVKHLEFVLPDGAVDNSWGTRQNKWTYWGSRTSDGMQQLACVSKENSIIAKALWRNFELLEKCTDKGKLCGGLMYALANEAACVHHSFVHAKSLAIMFLEMDDEFEQSLNATLPRENEGVKRFQNGCVYTVTKGDFVATINACDAYKYEGSEAGGGTISMLFNKEYGPIMASTTNYFVTTEPFNMQIQRHADEEVCCTARIDNSVIDATVELEQNDYQIIATSKQNGFKIKYDFCDDALKITVKSNKDATYILPIISRAGESIEMVDDKIRFNDMILVKCDSYYSIEPTGKKRYFHPVGGCQYKHIKISLLADKEVNIEIKKE